MGKLRKDGSIQWSGDVTTWVGNDYIKPTPLSYDLINYPINKED